MSKIDITSTALEKGIDIAKDFLDKLIMPTVEETGLLLKDKVTLWKFKNQVRMLNKAKEYCEKNGVSTKKISLKLLCPLLDNAALEEDEDMQDKWAILLSNLVDSEQNIENHVFPYILSQISKNEFNFVESEFLAKKRKTLNLQQQLEDYKRAMSEDEKTINDKLEAFKKGKTGEKHDTLEEYRLKAQLKNLERNEKALLNKIAEPFKVSEDGIQEFEMSNLMRLGLIRLIQGSSTSAHSIEIPNDPNAPYLNVDFDVDVELNTNYILTQLGELFILACTEKNRA